VKSMWTAGYKMAGWGVSKYIILELEYSMIDNQERFWTLYASAFYHILFLDNASLLGKLLQSLASFLKCSQHSFLPWH
jgi:hypothetical protein